MIRDPETFTIVVSGELGAGKTFAANYFERERGFEHLSFAKGTADGLVDKVSTESSAVP
jgi:dephospho-CoA kinase